MPSADFERTKQFYAQLKFLTAYEYPVEGYLILCRDKVELHFFRSPEHKAETSDHGVFVRVEDANVLSSEFQTLNLPAEGIPSVTTADNKPWGICELAVFDPDGNLLRMGHILDD